MQNENDECRAGRQVAIGLSGAHRVGKTTLAKEYVKKRGNLKFLDCEVSKFMADRDFSASANYPFARRLEIQELVLTHVVDKVVDARNSGDSFICDRTPLDVAAYLLMECGRHVEDLSEYDQRIDDFLTLAYAKTLQAFDVCVVIPPAIELVDAPGKAPPSRAMQMHLDLILTGMLSDIRKTFPTERRLVTAQLPFNLTDLSGRALFLEAQEIVTRWNPPA